MRKMVTRLIIAMCLSVIWKLAFVTGMTLSNPMVFFGALYIAAAWFSYLKLDGVKAFNIEFRKTSSDKKWTDRLGFLLKSKVNDDVKEDKAGSVKANIKANLFSAALLIVFSFFL